MAEKPNTLQQAAEAAKAVAGSKGPYQPRVGDVLAFYQNGDTTQDYTMAWVVGENPKTLDLCPVSVTRWMRTVQGIREVGDPFFTESPGRREILFQQGCWEEMSVARKRQDKRRADTRDYVEKQKANQRAEQDKAEQERVQQELGWQIEEFHGQDMKVDEIVQRLGGRVTVDQVNKHLNRQGLAAV